MFEFHVELMQNKFNFTLLVRNSGDVSLTELGKAFVNNLHKKIQDREKLVQVDRNKKNVIIDECYHWHFAREPLQIEPF